MTEELLDPLRRGWGHDTFRLWNETGLLGVVLPELSDAVSPHGAEAPFAALFWKMLHDLDARREKGEKHKDAVLLGVLFLPLVLSAIRARGAGKGVDASQILLVLDAVVNPLALRMSLPNLATHLVKQSLYTLGALTSTRPDHPAARRIVSRSWFPHALALLSLHSRASGRYHEAAAAWQDVLDRAGDHPEETSRTPPRDSGAVSRGARPPAGPPPGIPRGTPRPAAGGVRAGRPQAAAAARRPAAEE